MIVFNIIVTSEMMLCPWCDKMLAYTYYFL